MAFADRPLVQFATYIAGGALIMIAVVWFDASGALSLPGWFPQEGAVFAVGCAAVVAVSAWAVGLTTWREIAQATLIATGIHVAVYLLPLVFLLSVPLGAVVLFGAPMVLCVFFLYGAVILAATCLRLGHKPGGTA